MVPNPLNIPNPKAGDMGRMLGISTERMLEISKGLDAMCADKGKLRIAFMSDIIRHIEGICNTQEEFIWAMANHIQWLCKTDRMLYLQNKVR